jgi:2TM family of unknown function (DUF5676)
MVMKRLTIRGTALTLGIFFDVTFVLCVAWGMVLPSLHARGVPVLEAILPGFTWLTPGSFVLGLVEAFLFGVYVALIFVPLFNYFEGGRSGETRPVPDRHTVDPEVLAHR